MSRTSHFIVVACLLFIASPASAKVYDLAADFSATSNPNGAWSYGYTKTPGGTFTRETKKDTTKGVDYWESATGGNPFTSHNGTNAVVTIGTTQWQPGMVVSHPGPLGDLQVDRLTLVDAGTYQISGSFLGADSHGASADVYVLANGVTIFSGLVNGTGDASLVTFSLVRMLAANTTLDFVVGTGDGNYLFDAVAVSARIAPVPEPASYLMLGLGLVGLAVAWPARRAFAAKCSARLEP